MLNLWPDSFALRKLRDGVPWDKAALSQFISGCSDSRIRLFVQTFANIFVEGVLKRDLPVIGDIRADEVQTKQRGSIVFVENPLQKGEHGTEFALRYVSKLSKQSEPEIASLLLGEPAERSTADGWRTGSVIPYIPEITLPLLGVFPYVHDAPIGATDKYLNAYAGLVKSDAFVLCAHVRPDPYEGVRVYVYGEPGETKEVVLFNGQDRGRATMVTFASEPKVYESGVSQIVALSMLMALSTDIDVANTSKPVMLIELGSPDIPQVYFLHEDGTLETR